MLACGWRQDAFEAHPRKGLVLSCGRESRWAEGRLHGEGRALRGEQKLSGDGHKERRLRKSSEAGRSQACRVTTGTVVTGRWPRQGGAGGRTWAVDLASSAASGTPELRGLGKAFRISGLQLLPCEMW